jgi:hypothetical protein
MKESGGVMHQFESSHLFLVRLQAVEWAAGELRWHGRVQQVVSGENYGFAGWPELIEHVTAMLPDVSGKAEEDRPVLPSEDA